MSDSFIVFAPDVPEVAGHYRAPFDEERVGFSRNVAKAIGTQNIGFTMDRLPPGERSSFTHAHSHEEELVYVLEGTCHVRIIAPGQEPREVSLRAGHVVSFVAGTRIAHTFVNRGTTDCLLLVIGERKPDVDRCTYPEDREYDAAYVARKSRGA